MDERKDLLLRTAARLYSLGVNLDAAKDRIRKLVENSVGYDAPEMVQAAQEYTELEQQWEFLEQAYLQLRDEITTNSDG